MANLATNLEYRVVTLYQEAGSLNSTLISLGRCMFQVHQAMLELQRNILRNLSRPKFANFLYKSFKLLQLLPPKCVRLEYELNLDWFQRIRSSERLPKGLTILGFRRESTH